MDILDLLQQRFSTPSPHRRLVFWHDAEGERDIDELQHALDSLDVCVWEWTKENSFRTKYQLEVNDPDGSYLIYARFSRPTPLEDWLLDLRLCSDEFVADEVALLMERLSVSHLRARPFIQSHRAFFRSQERVRKVERLLPGHSREDQFVLAVLASAVGVDMLDVTQVLRKVLLLGLDEEQNTAVQSLLKWDLIDDFWILVRQTFGLAEEVASLQSFFDILAASHLDQGVDISLPPKWNIGVSTLPNTCRIFLDDTLRSVDGPTVVEYLSQFAIRFPVREWLAEQPYKDYVRCDTVPQTHLLLLNHLCDELLHETADPQQWQAILTLRKATLGYDDFVHAYEALAAALSLQEHKNAFASATTPKDAISWVNGYSTKWYEIDRLYRQFSTSVDLLHQPDWLAALKEQWDRWYTNNFLVTYGAWTDQMLANGQADNWPIRDVLQQRNFYRQMVADHLSRERVFIIISDALRYEAGQELAEKLRLRVNSEVEIKPMQASLPTYTKLGMASLLPGKSLSVDETGSIGRDGERTDSLEARERVLSATGQSVFASHWRDFQALSVQDGEECIKGKRVIYFYHDVIDATGDQAKSETHTFLAVRQTIEELMHAVDKLVRSYRAARIVVTSDHGFLYQSGVVEGWAKPTPIEGQIYDGNRRFAIGRSLSTPTGTRRVSLNYLGLDVEAVIASNIHRLTVRGGGQRFVHGGAMPQESIVPVITYRQIRGQKSISDQARVDIVVANRGRIVTSYEFKAVLFQEQKVGEMLRPRHLRIALYLDGTRISSEVTRAFDSQAEAKNRETDVVLHLFEREYPVGTKAQLRLQDVSGSETIEYGSYEVELRIVSLM